MENTFSKKEAFSYGWQQTKKNFGTFFLITVGVFVVSGIFSFFSRAAEGDGSLQSAVQIISFIIQLIIGFGLTQVVLKVYNGETPSLQDFIPSKNRFWQYLITTIVYSLYVIVGLILLIVPGIYFCLKYQFAPILVVDKGLEWKEALKESARLSEGQKWNLLWFVLLGILLNILGMILFFVGLIVTAPIVMMAYVFVYKKLTNTNVVTESIETQKTEEVKEESVSQDAVAVEGETSETKE